MRSNLAKRQRSPFSLLGVYKLRDASAASPCGIIQANPLEQNVSFGNQSMSVLTSPVFSSSAATTTSLRGGGSCAQLQQHQFVTAVCIRATVIAAIIDPLSILAVLRFHDTGDLALLLYIFFHHQQPPYPICPSYSICLCEDSLPWGELQWK